MIYFYTSEAHFSELLSPDDGFASVCRGPFISALDKTWCPDHFICANPHCRAPLVNCGFVEEEGQLFCEKDYELYFAPHCGNCGRAIIGVSLVHVNP